MTHRDTFERDFTRLFEERFATVFRYVHRLSGEAELAADITQEAFVRLYQRGTIPDEPAAWLATVAVNLLRDERRTAARRAVLLARDAGEPGAAATPETDLLAAEQRRDVRAALDSLRPRDREMLLLRHSGYSYREIAAVLGIGENGIGTMLARATAAFTAAFSSTRVRSGRADV